VVSLSVGVSRRPISRTGRILVVGRKEAPISANTGKNEGVTRVAGDEKALYNYRSDFAEVENLRGCNSTVRKKESRYDEIC